MQTITSARKKHLNNPCLILEYNNRILNPAEFAGCLYHLSEQSRRKLQMWKEIVGVLATVFTVGVITNWCKECIYPSRRAKDEDIMETLFFTNVSANCRHHLQQNVQCSKKDCPVGHMRKIINYIDSARHTLDICMYLFSHKDLAKAVINAKRKGIIVRLILDESGSNNVSSQAMYFYENDIRPRMINVTDGYMHNKFVIIDQSIVITGSANWTMNGFFGNFENVIISNESSLVQSFLTNFETVWIMAMYEP